MKLKIFLLLLSAITVVLSCAKDEGAPEIVKVSDKSLHFSGNGGVWMLTINSNSEWQVSGTTPWCTVDKPSGVNTGGIVIKVDTNHTGDGRYAHIVVKGARTHAELTVSQDSTTGDYHYQLPVIFHILYNTETDTMQNIKGDVIPMIIAECNRKYNRGINSVDMNMELVAATEDPAGNPLQEAGIERLQRITTTKMSCITFMGEQNAAEAKMLWDPNKYINVFIYTFTEENTLGISHLPYTLRENSLTGLYVGNVYLTKTPNYPHCISLNSSYSYEKEQNSPATTMAHELGHYLGLFHVFGEKDCNATDYCDDTPSYNRAEYTAWLESNNGKISWLDAVRRNSCDGSPFISYNIMDYDYSYMDRLTTDQFNRVRFVLTNSPLIPGPKNVSITKSVPDNVIPEIRFMP